MSADYKDYGYQLADSNWSDSYLMVPLRRLLGPPRGPVLDIGCGNGAISRALLEDGYDVYGIDASESGIEIANRNAPGRFFVHDVTVQRLPDALADKRFVTVISTEVISHLYAPRRLLDLAREVLADDGELIVSMPYHGYFKNLALAVSGRLDPHFTVLWDGGFIKFFSRRTIEQMLREQGFAVTDFAGAGRWPYLWKSMLVKARVA
ncbi:MAG: class I SAM-dependent methyltransferase [Sulfuricellaceae bacterium]|nr:class I SAM-dependent methyltransferase [Sulfuricellaceae bacterium]